MRKGIDEFAWIQGVAAMNPNNYVPFDIPGQNKWGQEVEILVDDHTPETAFIEKEKEVAVSSRYQNLSDEAKQIINIVINSPQELARIFLTGQGKIAKGEICCTRLEGFLTKQWKDKRYARHVIQEIKEFVRLF